MGLVARRRKRIRFPNLHSRNLNRISTHSSVVDSKCIQNTCSFLRTPHRTPHARTRTLNSPDPFTPAHVPLTHPPLIITRVAPAGQPNYHTQQQSQQQSQPQSQQASGHSTTTHTSVLGEDGDEIDESDYIRAHALYVQLSHLFLSALPLCHCSLRFVSSDICTICIIPSRSLCFSFVCCLLIVFVVSSHTGTTTIQRKKMKFN